MAILLRRAVDLNFYLKPLSFLNYVLNNEVLEPYNLMKLVLLTGLIFFSVHLYYPTKVRAIPFLLARPVRPMRWTYVS